MVQWAGCSQSDSSSPQNLLNVVDGSNPKISRSSRMRKETVDAELPMKYLKNKSTNITIHRLLQCRNLQQEVENHTGINFPENHSYVMLHDNAMYYRSFSIYCPCKIKLSIENHIVIKYSILISYGISLSSPRYLRTTFIR